MINTCIVATGGTFEKAYSLLDERMVLEGGSVIPELMEKTFLRDCDFVSLFQIDSLRMAKHHREALLEWILSARYSRIVIVHGTSRMVETARFLRSHVTNKVVVLTGALYPYRYSPSEAASNLGGAVGVSRLLGFGTFVFMHGVVFEADRCRKDAETGLFEADS